MIVKKDKTGFTPLETIVDCNQQLLLTKISSAQTVKKRNSLTGFTLVEMLISASILVLVVLSVIDIYFRAIGAQKKIGRMANVLQDAQFVMESIAKDIRLSEIDYAYDYDADLVSDGGVHGIQNDEIELALKNNLTPGWYLRYRLNGAVIERISSATGVWQPVTKSNITIDSLKFFIKPEIDPFSHGSNDPLKEQSHVTIAIKIKSLEGNDSVVLQQTVPQRLTQKR